MKVNDDNGELTNQYIGKASIEPLHKQIKREMIESSVDSFKGIKYHFKKPIFGSETNRCEYVSESFEIEEKFDISKFTIKTAIWNEYEIITSILYNYEARGWWSENEKSLEPTLDIG